MGVKWQYNLRGPQVRDDWDTYTDYSSPVSQAFDVRMLGFIINWMSIKST